MPNYFVHSNKTKQLLIILCIILTFPMKHPVFNNMTFKICHNIIVENFIFKFIWVECQPIYIS